VAIWVSYLQLATPILENFSMEFIIIIALILLNGIFSMAEMSLVSAKKYKLEIAKKKGVFGADAAIKLSENPNRFLSTVQIGITLIGILLGIYSGDSLTKKLELLVTEIEFLAPYAPQIAVSLIVIAVTYFSIVIGELFPKRLGLTFPESIAIFLAKPMQIISSITLPFVWLLSISNNFLSNLFGIKNKDKTISEEEIKTIIKESVEFGEIQEIEHDIVERVFELGDRKVNTLYTHRVDLVYFNIDDDLETIKQKIDSEKHSAYPVCNANNIDDILGIVLLKDLFKPSLSAHFNLADHIKKPLFFNENTYAYKVLELFKSRRTHYGIVVDEYGSTLGIVTMDDMLDALVGDVSEEGDEEYEITKRDENSWFVDGQYSLIDFIKYFGLQLDKNIKFTTVAGLAIHHSNSFPNVGDKIIIQDLELEIVDKDGQRIDKIIVRRLEDMQ